MVTEQDMVIQDEALYPDTWVSFHPTYTAFCRIGQDKFRGEMDITYRINAHGQVLEYMAFEAWLAEVTATPTIIEKLYTTVYEKLVALGFRDFELTVYAETRMHGPVEVFGSHSDEGGTVYHTKQ